MPSLVHYVPWIFLCFIFQRREPCHSPYRSLICSFAFGFRCSAKALRQSNAPNPTVILLFPSSFRFSPSAFLFSSLWPSFTNCPFSWRPPTGFVSYLSLSVPLQAFSAPPLDLREILSGFHFENVFSLHPHFTPTAEKRPNNIDEDGLVKLLLSNL